MFKKGILFTFFTFALLLPLSFVHAGTVLSAYKYAWSSDVGYINFENVLVGDSNLTGFAWSENTGWINFSPAQGGVYNDGQGHLSGFAWGEGLGWIDFSGVVISTTTGKFSGTATGDAVGTLNFSCPNFCDVRTDWTIATSNPTTTPAVVPTNQGPSSGGSLTGLFSGSTKHVESYNDPLIILPDQSGFIRKDVNAGTIEVSIPKNNLLAKTIVTINESAIDSTNDYLLPEQKTIVNGEFYDIYAIDENGLYVHNFSHPITITLPLSKNQIGKNNLGVYWLNETNWKWVLIPDAQFLDNKVVFNVRHLTKFAVFEIGSVSNIKKPMTDSLSLPSDKKKQFMDMEKEIVSSSTRSSIENLDKDATKKKFNGYAMFAVVLIGAAFIAVLKRKKY